MAAVPENGDSFVTVWLALLQRNVDNRDCISFAGAEVANGGVGASAYAMAVISP